MSSHERYTYDNNYIRNKKNHDRKRRENAEESLRNIAKNRIEKEKKYGKFEGLITVGENDRIDCNAPQIFDDESMQLSYSYGYFERGSRVLEGKFAKGIYSPEKQKNFGMQDVINGVPEKNIENLKDYPDYLEGRIYQMGRNAFDFIEQQGISIQEYISIMGLIYPEVNTETFLNGYNARKEEQKNKKNR